MNTLPPKANKSESDLVFTRGAELFCEEKRFPKDADFRGSDIQSQNRLNHFIERYGRICAGVHLIIDLYDAHHLDDTAYIEETLRACIRASKATLLHIHLHPFEPTGVSGVAVLAESHISIHTWPKAGYAALDVFMCGESKPEKCLDVLRTAFTPREIAVSEHLRGTGVN